MPPQMRTGDSWYQGTADAIYQNLYLLSRSAAKYVVVLSGDHIYRMDYAPMLTHHKESGAELTVACMEVPREEANSFGVMAVNDQYQVIEFAEKPETPASIPNKSDSSLVSMGIYIFSIDALASTLERDADNPTI